MKTKLLTFALLLMGVSAGAQTPISVSIFDDCSQNGQKTELRPSGTENGYTWVNLGLSVQWATMNVGATTPEDYGYYFAWGETATKSDYSWSTYKYCKGTYTTMTKYCTDSSWGTVDNKTTLEAEDDAAHVKWGGTWRMPTDAEWTELREQCTWKWTTQNGINGYLVTSKKNGNSIFLPAAGCRYDTLLYVRSYGYYWSSSLHENYSDDAYYAIFNSNDVYRHYYHYRHGGLSVRPVCQNVSATDYYTLTLYANGCDAPNTVICDAGQQLSVSAYPMAHRHFVKWNDGNTDNPRLVTLNQNLTYTASFAPDSFNVSLAASPAVYGSVSGAGRYQYNDPAILTATPNYGYKFSRWSDGNTDNPRTIYVTSDCSFQAIFTKKQFNLQGMTTDDSQGYVSGGGWHLYQDSVTIQANSNVGYAFSQWNDGSVENPRTIYLVSDTAFTASFYQLYEGKCGDNLSWKYADNTLTITGTGAMYDYTSSTMPWKLFCDSITKIIFENGITSIGENAFVGCTNVGHVYCAANVPPKCPDNAFESMGQFSTILHVSANSVDMYKIALGWRFFFNILGDYDNTALEDMLLNNQNTSKFIQNGQLYILRDGKTYMMQGTEIK